MTLDTDIDAMLADLAAMGDSVTVVFVPAGEPAPDVATVELLPVLERSVSGLSAAIDLDAYSGEKRFVLVAGAATHGSSSTLDVKLRHCATVGGTYEDVPSGAFTRVTTAASMQALVFATGLERYLKIAWTIGGTNEPAFVFGLALEAAPVVAGQTYTVNGSYLREAFDVFDDEQSPGVQVVRDTVLVRTAALPGLAIGSTIAVDGQTKIVHALHPEGDGKTMRIFLRNA